MKKLVKIINFYYNVDNIVDIEPTYKIDVDSKEKIEVGCAIYFNCASNGIYHTDIEFGMNNGKPTHTTAEVVDHLNRGEDLDD